MSWWKSEIRRPKKNFDPLIRTSAFGFPSAFGFRVSDSEGEKVIYARALRLLIHNLKVARPKFANISVTIQIQPGLII